MSYWFAEDCPAEAPFPTKASIRPSRASQSSAPPFAVGPPTTADIAATQSLFRTRPAYRLHAQGEHGRGPTDPLGLHETKTNERTLVGGIRRSSKNGGGNVERRARENDAAYDRMMLRREGEIAMRLAEWHEKKEYGIAMAQRNRNQKT